ncbi:MAG: ABC transporter permease [Planctomycetes bacterium]|nr:ABC transporter permease [Planctomycetota bacterium]MCW8134960.1 ABC transporter permease [Planctomycetota bacterium]
MKFVLKNLARRKLRTTFSVLGVGIGVSIMVALFTISDDFIGQIQQAFETQRGDIVVTQATAEELESDVALYHEDQLRGISGVTVASPMIAAILRTDADFDDRPAILYYGIRADNPLVSHMHMLEGEQISDEHPDGVVFGWRAWEILQQKMGDKAPKVGKPLDLMDIVTSQGFQQVFSRPDNWDEMTDYGKKMWALLRLTKELGVHPDAIKEETPAEYETRTGRKAPPPRPLNLLGLPLDDDQYAKWLKERHGIDYDPAHPEYAYRMKLQLVTRGVCRTGIMIQDSAVFFHLNIAQIIKGKHERVEKIKVRKDGKLVEEEVQRPASCTVFVLEVQAMPGDESRAAAVTRVRDAINQSIDELRAARSGDVLQRHKEIDFFEKFGLVISLIAALAGAIGILNTMTLSVFERTREIGLLLAVGWSRMRVLYSIMLEGLVLSIIGGLAGVAFGYLEVQVARVYFAMDALSGDLNVTRSLHALALAFGIGFLASLYPAVRAAMLQPIDALRHE